MYASPFPLGRLEKGGSFVVTVRRMKLFQPMSKAFASLVSPSQALLPLRYHQALRVGSHTAAAPTKIKRHATHLSRVLFVPKLLANTPPVQ